jgi:hypothetical protein
MDPIIEYVDIQTAQELDGFMLTEWMHGKMSLGTHTWPRAQGHVEGDAYIAGGIRYAGTVRLTKRSSMVERGHSIPSSKQLQYVGLT